MRALGRREQDVGALEIGLLAVRCQRWAGAQHTRGECRSEQGGQEYAETAHGRYRHVGAEKVAVFVALGSVSASLAPDDIVHTHAEAQGNSRPPLLVLEPLRGFLDEHGL